LHPRVYTNPGLAVSAMENDGIKKPISGTDLVMDGENPCTPGDLDVFCLEL
jgi:hypothetical protein